MVIAVIRKGTREYILGTRHSCLYPLGTTDASHASAQHSRTASRASPTMSCRSPIMPLKRLHRVYHRMRARGKLHNVVIVACARELACFLWAAAAIE